MFPRHGLIQSFAYAFEGIAYCFNTQRNFRIELAVAVLVLPLTAWLQANVAVVALCCIVVLTLEMLNTAIEALVDLVTQDIHPLAKIAKDVAAAAVLMASFGAIIVGLSELTPPLIEKIILWQHQL